MGAVVIKGPFRMFFRLWTNLYSFAKFCYRAERALLFNRWTLRWEVGQVQRGEQACCGTGDVLPAEINKYRQYRYINFRNISKFGQRNRTEMVDRSKKFPKCYYLLQLKRKMSIYMYVTKRKKSGLQILNVMASVFLINSFSRRDLKINKKLVLLS